MLCSFPQHQLLSPVRAAEEWSTNRSGGGGPAHGHPHYHHGAHGVGLGASTLICLRTLQGVEDRRAAVRIPTTVLVNQCGWYEDRRPAANMDPYLVTMLLVCTTLGVPLPVGGRPSGGGCASGTAGGGSAGRSSGGAAAGPPAAAAARSWTSWMSWTSWAASRRTRRRRRSACWPPSAAPTTSWPPDPSRLGLAGVRWAALRRTRARRRSACRLLGAAPTASWPPEGLAPWGAGFLSWPRRMLWLRCQVQGRCSVVWELSC